MNNKKNLTNKQIVNSNSISKLYTTNRFCFMIYDTFMIIIKKNIFYILQAI